MTDKPQEGGLGEEGIEKLPEITEDMEITDKLIGHIIGPCEVVVNGKTENIRDFYIREGEKLLATLTDEKAKQKLKNIIAIYKP